MMLRPQVLGKEITTTNLSKPNTPDFVVVNGRNRDIKIYYVTIVPDTTFKSSGAIVIEHEGNPNLIEFSAGTLVRASELVLQMTTEGARFDRNASLKVFTWLFSAGTGKCSVFITIGE